MTIPRRITVEALCTNLVAVYGGQALLRPESQAGPKRKGAVLLLRIFPPLLERD